MAEYRYVGNLDPQDGTERLIFPENNDLPYREIERNGVVELTDDEHRVATQRVVLEDSGEAENQSATASPTQVENSSTVYDRG